MMRIVIQRKSNMKIKEGKIPPQKPRPNNTPKTNNRTVNVTKTLSIALFPTDLLNYITHLNWTQKRINLLGFKISIRLDNFYFRCSFMIKPAISLAQ